MKPARLMEITRDAMATATLLPTAGHVAPAEVTATPAVILRPADPWIVPNRRVAYCPEVRWNLQIVAGRYDLTSSLGALTVGYLAAVAALHDAKVGQIGPLGLVEPTDVAGVQCVAGTFTVTIPYDPGA